MDFDPQLGWRILEDSGFNSMIGPIRFARMAEDLWVAELTVEPRHINMGGVCHGGVYMALADVAMGAAVYEAGGHKRCATIDFDAHFIAAAKLGQTLRAEARIDRIAGDLAFMKCEVHAGGRQCLRAQGIWKYLSPRA